MRILAVVVLLSLAGCAGSNQVSKPISDFRYCDNKLAENISKYKMKYHESVFYNCEPIVSENTYLDVKLLEKLPNDAKLIGGQIVTATETNAPPNTELADILRDHVKFIGANVLIEDRSAYTASPETHYYRAYYSASLRSRKKVDRSWGGDGGTPL